MKFHIICIGKLKQSRAEASLIKDYLKKCHFQIQIVELEEKKNLPDFQMKEKEAELLLSKVPEGAKIIALDEHGDLLSSLKFSQKISDFQNERVKDVCFLIGGAFGHGEAVKEKASFLLSFGRMTLPHFLARVVLIEQIYRAQTLLDGHPYHKE